MTTASKVIARTDTHTQRLDENITSTAYAGGNNKIYILSFLKQNVTHIGKKFKLNTQYLLKTNVESEITYKK